jgi:hypothetical protein
MKGRFLPLSNSAVLGTTACGIPCGAASGITLMNTPESLRRQMAYPADVLNIQDQDSLDYTMIRFALENDLNIIVGNNAGRLEKLFALVNTHRDNLIADIERGTISESIQLDPKMRQSFEALLSPNPDRAKELKEMIDRSGSLQPQDYWPGLTLISCWLSGSVGRYLETVRSYFNENTLFMDCGYGASEGKFNVPLRPSDPTGPLTLHGYFFEFAPLDGGPTLLAHELKDQTSYELIITSYSGLYRYDMHDIVRVQGFTGNTPNIYFETKSGEIGNICGEKVSGTVIQETFDALPSELKSSIRHYCVVPDEDTRSYHFCVEFFDGKQELASKILPIIERELSNHCLPYKIFRSQEMIKTPRLIVMKPGWQSSLYASRQKPGRSINQIKLPVVTRTLPESDWILKAEELQ